MDALAGAVHCIGNLHPILLIETIKSDKSAIAAWLDNLGYIGAGHRDKFFAIQRRRQKSSPTFKMANPAAR